MRKTNTTSRLPALLMALAMMLTLLPISALADDDSIRVYVSYQNDGYIIPKQQMTVSSGLSDTYGYTDNVTDGVSALDVLIAAHEVYFDMYVNSGTFEDWLTSALVDSGGWITTTFNDSGSISFALNGEMPFDNGTVYPASPYGPESYHGLSIHETVVDSDDYIEFLFYMDSYMLSDCYTWFEYEGAKIESLTVQTGKAIGLSLVGYPFMSYGSATDASYRDGSWTADHSYCDDLPIVILNPATGSPVGAAKAYADEDGDFSLTFSEPGTYIISALGDADYWQYIFAPWLEVTVTPAATGGGTGGGGDTPVDTWGDYKPTALDYVPDDFENGLWLQYDFKELAIGQTATIYPRRVEQAVTNLITNDVERPNFNFEIVEGDSVTITPTRTSLCKNSSWFDKATVTAVKQGVTIVKVTYDAITHSTGKYFPACSEVNAAYVAFSVTDGTDTGITIDFNDSLRSYDTVYFTGDGVDYDINPTITGADTIEVTCNGVPVPGSAYTLPLQNMQNIIAIKATNVSGSKYAYKMIDARKIEINVVNKTSPGEEIKAGNTATVSFKGITIPVYKLATIYNPILGSSAYVQYTAAGLGTFQGRSNQFDLATQNSFNVAFDSAGDYTFTGGAIYQSWFGDKLGSDKSKEGVGSPNTNAPTYSDWFSIMPDFKITVAEGDDPDRPVDNYDPETGWFTIYNPEGSLLGRLQALLEKEPFNQLSGGTYDYSVIKKLRIAGTMAAGDFYGTNGLRPNWSTNTSENGNLRSLTDLDMGSAVHPSMTFSGRTYTSSEIPSYAFAYLNNLVTLRLPAGAALPGAASANANPSNFNGCSSLTALVFGDGPLVPGVLDFSNSGITNFAGGVTPTNSGLTSPDIKKIILPVNTPAFSTNNTLHFFTALEEAVFPGAVTSIGTGLMANSIGTISEVYFYHTTAPSISTTFSNAVAYVPDPTSGGYELSAFTSRFKQVLPLTPAPDVGAELSALIAEAEGLLLGATPGIGNGQYPQSKIDALNRAAVYAQSVASKPNRTQEEIGYAADWLADALADFKAAKVTVDYGPLESLIATAENLLLARADKIGDGDEQYPQVSYDTFESAVNAAKAVAENPNATPAMITNAVSSLNSAREMFNSSLIVWEHISDKDVLVATIATAKGKVAENYTSKSWGPFAVALAAAELAAEDKNAPQTDVDAANSALLAAMNALDSVGNSNNNGGTNNSISVTFRLIGSTLSNGEINFMSGGADYKGAEYVTWIATKTYTFPISQKATVYDLFVQALKDAGLTAIGQDSNYVSAIYAPATLGGYKLAEFTNGPNSGWMYTINGKHPGYGLQGRELANGDVVIWHYVDDFMYEVKDWFNGDTLGNSSIWSKWLDAEDKNPIKDNNNQNQSTVTPTGTGGSPAANPNVSTVIGDTKPQLSVWTNPFGDLKESDWFYAAVRYAYESGLMKGTADNEFSPDTLLTRAMLVTILYRCEGEPAVTVGNPFSDVEAGQWYTDAVIWANANGIVEGYGDGIFGTDDNITREQAATILMRYAKWKGLDVSKQADLSAYTDAGQISDWALEAIKWAVAEGLITGRTTTTLVPQGTATRAEIATLLMRFIEDFVK